MTHIVFPTTKSEKDKCASNAVAALGQIENLWNELTYTPQLQSMHRNPPFGIIRSDGTASVTIQANHALEARLSNHERLKVVAQREGIEEAFQKFTGEISLLLPGYPLSWTLQGGSPHKHLLHLGHGKKASSNSTHVIATTKSRWKAPLLRLCEYLHDADARPVPPKTLRQWLFAGCRYSYPRGVAGNIPSTLVNAADLSKAFRLMTFRNRDNSAAPRPYNDTSRLALEVGQSFEVDALQELVHEKKVQTSGSIALCQNQLEHELRQPAESLNTALLALNSELLDEAVCQIDCDFISRAVILSMTDHPLVAQSDLDAAKIERQKIQIICEDITEILSRHILSVHPDAQHACLQININGMTARSNNFISLRFHIDGLRRSPEFSDLALMIQDAAVLAMVMKPGNNKSYMVDKPKCLEESHINKNDSPIMISATSPEHAILLYCDGANPFRSTDQHPMLYELMPVRIEDWSAASSDASERINQVYPD